MKEKKKIVLSNELMYVEHINDSQLTDEELKDFDVFHKEGENLALYLKRFAEIEENNNLMRTYIVRDNIDDSVVGYFSLKAGMVSAENISDGKEVTLRTRPGIELANFAINSTYLKKHKNLKGCGIMIFSEFVMEIVRSTSKLIGVTDIYIFSLPVNSLIERYKEYGFVRLNEEDEEALHARLKPIYDEGCIFMYQKI